MLLNHFFAWTYMIFAFISFGAGLYVSKTIYGYITVSDLIKNAVMAIFPFVNIFYAIVGLIMALSAKYSDFLKTKVM